MSETTKPRTPPDRDGPERPAVPVPAGGPAMRPGDQAPPGTPGTGEDICHTCQGRGIRDGRPCPECQGTGRVTVGLGGG
jgi:hypothetical protein